VRVSANPSLAAFQHALATALSKAGLRHRAGQAFTPHVTLLYGDREVQPQPIEPLRWTAGEFVLVHSLLGKSVYKPLGRWSLQG
jgi:2'-5' RNA ligase